LLNDWEVCVSLPEGVGGDFSFREDMTTIPGGLGEAVFGAPSTPNYLVARSDELINRIDREITVALYERAVGELVLMEPDIEERGYGDLKGIFGNGTQRSPALDSEVGQAPRHREVVARHHSRRAAPIGRVVVVTPVP
jgi:hypothetical protein